MAYATLAEFKEHIGEGTSNLYAQLTDRTGQTTPSAVDAVATRALSGADGEINSYLGQRYKVPIAAGDAEVDALLNAMSLDLAEWQLWKGNNRKLDVPQRVQDARDDRIAHLQRIADGKAVLPSAELLDGASAQGTTAIFGSNKRLLTESTLKRM